MTPSEALAWTLLGAFLERGFEDPAGDGTLWCRMCGATNAENEPVEDDEIVHQPDCSGVTAQLAYDNHMEVTR